MIYLASPYSDEDEKIMEARYQAVLAEVAFQTVLGVTVYSPIVHYHHAALKFDLPKNFSFWIKHDFKMLEAASELWVLCIQGFKESRGVQAEIAYAEARGKIVTYISEKRGG